MIQCIPMYVSNVQRNTGTCKPLPLYRQDHRDSFAAIKIQRMWRECNNMVYVPYEETWDNTAIFNSSHTGAFHLE